MVVLYSPYSSSSRVEQDGIPLAKGRERVIGHTPSLVIHHHHHHTIIILSSYYHHHHHTIIIIIIIIIIHHPSSIIHHPSSIIHHPSSIIHHPSSIIHHPPSTIHHPSSSSSSNRSLIVTSNIQGPPMIDFFLWSQKSGVKRFLFLFL